MMTKEQCIKNSNTTRAAGLKAKFMEDGHELPQRYER